MAEDRAQERTEKATPQRRKRAREQGQVAKSQELNSVLMLITGLLLISSAFPYLMENSRELVTTFLRLAGEGRAAESRFGAMFNGALIGMFKVLAPVLIGTVVAALASNLAQVGFHASPASITPKLEKLNPIEGVKRIFGKRALFELGKGIFKLIVIGLVAYVTYKSRITDVVDLMFFVPSEMASGAIGIAAQFLVRTFVALGILAAMDYAWQKWEFEKQIRMSLQDVKEELKENEGDPLLKSRMRSIQQKLASQRMMDDVKDAALVITNPTHYAVALGYDDDNDTAPRVVAKGADEVARRIRELAREHDVPLVEKPELARMLYRECDVDDVIPVSLYEAVAQVLAYVYSLNGGRKH